MIFLIDDKKKRQHDDFGWSQEKLNHISENIQCIYTLEDLTERSAEIFKEGNVVIYHESFLDNTSMAKEAAEKRNKLDEFAKKNPNFYLAMFSGSKTSRSLDKNIAHLPVSKVYQNLEAFAKRYSESDRNLNYLLFGENPKIEKELSEKLNQALLSLDNEPAKITHTRNLFLRTVNGNIQNAIQNAVEKTLFNDVSDEKFSNYVDEWLSENEYDNIFIPLCFGPTFSDYNGLRLATHIRCTKTPNQLKNIFIYGFVKIDYLFLNDYFNILKTKNVFLVEFKKSSFQEAANLMKSPLKIEELPQEISKLNLDPPKNYEDTHSINNEWAIHQWASTINIEQNEELKKVFNNVQYNLYFKYLKTTNPISENSTIPKEQLKIEKDGKPRVLLIDDESDKGWYEIFAYLLGDLNSIYTDYIGNEFKSLSRHEIINHSIQKIDADNIDVVILDFRLNIEDFSQGSLNDITSIQLLKEIKKINPGIQVIVFSATNKVWNLQALQEAGADGFIIKTSRGNSKIGNFSNGVIRTLISSLEKAIKRQFLKEYFETSKRINRNLLDFDTEDDSDFNFFIKDLSKQIGIIETSMKSINLSSTSTLDLVFLNCFNFLEKFKHHFLIEEDYKLLLGDASFELNRYEKLGNEFISNGTFVRDNQNDNPSWFQTLAGLFVDYFGIVDIKSKDILNLWHIKNIRNDYIHSNKPSFDQNEVLMILLLCEKITSNLKE